MGIISRKKSREPSGRSENAELDIFMNDRSIHMTAFLMKVVGLWLARDDKEQRKRDLTFIYTVLAIGFGAYVEIADFYYTWPNFSDSVYVACNVLCLAVGLLKLTIVFIHKKKFMALIAYARKHYWHSNYNKEERALIYECQKLSMFAISFINFFAQACGVSYIVNPLIANIGRNDSERTFPFTLWIDLPITVTPYYEIIYCAQILITCHVIICYICFDNLLCLLNLHVATQFRILQHKMTLLGITEDYNTSATYPPSITRSCYDSLKSCVRIHQRHVKYTEDVESVFTGIILGNVVASSLVLCLVGYQILLSSKLMVYYLTCAQDEATATRRVMFICNFFASTAQLILLTYSCNGLIQESSKVAIAIYSGPWINLPMNKDGRQIRNDLKMIIGRAGKPCCLTAGGFCSVSLETSTTIFSTAMSYLTLLRQSDE